MKVRELIERLQQLPENHVVVDFAGLGADSGGYGEIDMDGYTDVLYAGLSEIERNDADQDVVEIGLGLE